MPTTPLNDTQVLAIASKERIDPSLVRTISNAAVANDVEPTLLLAMAKRETDFGRSPQYDAASGLGDGAHGHGMFQLDDRSRSHAPFLSQVEHDPAKAADVAAAMLHDTLANGHSPLDALHIYNSGKLDRPSTMGEFQGRKEHYETAVAGWAHEYDVAAGIAAPAPHVEKTVTTESDQALVNSRISEAAEKMRGMSTRDAQTHHPELENGNVACAYSVNKVLDTALGRTYGENREYVPSLMADLRRHGSEVAAGDVRPGDIAIKLPGNGERHGHIGIVTRGGADPLILNNSSSHGSFTNEDSQAHFSRNYVTKREEDKVVYIRIDPASVDLKLVRETPIPEHVLGPDNAPPDPKGWTDHHPVQVSRPKTPPTQTDDRHSRNDVRIYGELRDGVRQESAVELARKNEIIAEAIGDAKVGNTLDFRFAGNGKESAREVALQNQKLDRAIEANLPADAKPHLVPLSDHAKAPVPDESLIEKAGHVLSDAAKSVGDEIKHWTPDLDFEKFGKLLEKARGGVSHEAPKVPAKSVDRSPDRSNGIGQ